MRDIVTGLLDFIVEQHGMCRACAFGKNLKDAFPRSENKSKRILGLIHLDVCCPMLVVSVQGASYYVTFIGDFSRKTLIFFMKTKDEAFDLF